MEPMPQNDHDLLIAIATKLDSLMAEVKAITDKLPDKADKAITDDHEKRLRYLEKFMVPIVAFLVLGGAALIYYVVESFKK